MLFYQVGLLEKFFKVKFSAIKIGNIERALELEDFDIPDASIRYLINLCRAQQAALILAKKHFSQSISGAGMVFELEKLCGEINDHVG